MIGVLLSAFLLMGCGNGIAGTEDMSSYDGQESNEMKPSEGSENEDRDSGGQMDDSGQTDGEEEEALMLRDAVRETLDCYVGAAVTLGEIRDEEVWNIITTYFSAITIGNELKPDAMFGYSNSRCPGTEIVELNGQEIVVPKLDYSRAEGILDKVLEWNNENPDRQIKVRGHVLVWHSQTPEWFFHVDYDKDKDYVDKETMNIRLEWYIRAMLTHFAGEESKYKGMFYGWDVVNEAVSDGTGTYRSDTENPDESLSKDTHGSNSSWWHVYRSNEYIINAFLYANKYAPADLELYYNDYNECVSKKRNGIRELLLAVKDREGAPGEGTRIDAMGMQGHYNMTSPGTLDIYDTIEAYAKIVENVQITELDLKASDEYDGSAEAKEKEYEAQAKRYNGIYWALKSAEENGLADITGLTFWGTVDHYSWLQNRSDVGGGNTEALPQCPLLFDENYEPKPAYYIFVTP